MAVDYRQIARDAARAAGIDANLFERQIEAESGFNPNARSPAGASGIAQIMPGTARGWGVNPMDPRAALYESARRMAQYQNQYGSYRDALVAYNAGPGRVGKPLYDETRNYINRIMGGVTERAELPSPQSGTEATGSSYRTDLLEQIFKGTPYEGLAKERSASRASSSTGEAGYQPAVGADPAPGGRDWRWLQRVAREKFGLQNDPGDSQTTGGRHTQGSLHYSGRAIDFGDARNSRAQLNAWYQWALANRDKYGFSEVLDEGNHIHVGF